MSKTTEQLEEIIEFLKEQNGKCSTIQVTIDGKVLVELSASKKRKLSDVEPGEIIVANGHKYIVLEHLENGETLIISLDTMIDRTVFDNDSPDYKTSALKRKIDSECLPIFESDFGAENIVEHEVALTTVDMQKNFGTVRCKARPITFDEARKYNDLLVNKKIKGWYWTLTPWSTQKRGWEYSVSVVSPSGLISNNLCNCNFGVRPVCILKSSIFVSVE